MLKYLSKLGLLTLSVAILWSNVLFADDGDNVVDEVSEVANLTDKYLASGKSIRYVQGHVAGVDSCCKWWHFCSHKAITDVEVHLYIRGSNENGGEKWKKLGESKTDEVGFYSFGQLKDYCGPIQVKVPSLQHPPVVDYNRRCGILDNGRELDVEGKLPCKK